ncbi:hypothetical protein Vadar_015108, partial [Vaccinium darrowii]
WSVH